MLTVFAIAELREAILIEFALLHQQDRHCDALHYRRPVVELFPLQCVNQAFATTIRQSPELQSLMWGTDGTSPLYWFLSTLNMYRVWDGRRKPRKPCNVRFEVETNLKDVGQKKWMLRKTWADKDASWREIKVFPNDGSRRGFELDFSTSPYRSNKRWVQTLRRVDDPTLGTVYDFIQAMVCELQYEMHQAELRSIPTAHRSAMSEVIGIPELREAILIEYALISQKELPNRDLYSPAIELFPLQRVCRGFAATIRYSPQLRDLMCLRSHPKSISPLDWFLSTLSMSRNRVRKSHAEHFEIRTNIRYKAEEKWALPKSWHSRDASWRRIKIFTANHGKLAMQLDIHADPFDDEFEEGPQSPRRIDVLHPEDNPTLATVHELIEEVVRGCEQDFNRHRSWRTREAAVLQAERIKARVAYYGEEVNAAYPRGRTPPPVREEYKQRYWAQRRATRGEFLDWRRDQRQREYEAEVMEHRRVCDYCQKFDVDEG